MEESGDGRARAEIPRPNSGLGVRLKYNIIRDKALREVTELGRKSATAPRGGVLIGQVINHTATADLHGITDRSDIYSR